MSVTATDERDPIGDRMKDYEAATRVVLPRRSYAAIRLDGRAFHTWTRGLDRPFDPGLVDVMGAILAELCDGIDGAILGYAQSDELSIIIHDFRRKGTQPWFGGGVQKIASVSASMLTASFARSYPERAPAVFDARVFPLPSRVEVCNYLLWRQRDARRNSVTMVAEGYFSHRELLGKHDGDRREMLAERGVDVDAVDGRFLNGQVAHQVERTGEVEYVDKRTGDTRTSGPVVRREWVVTAAPTLNADENGWLAERLPVAPDPSPSLPTNRDLS